MLYLLKMLQTQMTQAVPTNLHLMTCQLRNRHRLVDFYWETRQQALFGRGVANFWSWLSSTSTQGAFFD